MEPGSYPGYLSQVDFIAVSVAAALQPGEVWRDLLWNQAVTQDM